MLMIQDNIIKNIKIFSMLIISMQETRQGSSQECSLISLIFMNLQAKFSDFQRMILISLTSRFFRVSGDPVLVQTPRNKRKL